MERQKLGIFFGKLAPMHIGHYETIMRAKKECDKALIIVSFYSGDEGDKIGISLTKRLTSIRKLFKDDENVIVDFIDESNLERYPNGWDSWYKLISTKTAQYTHESTDLIWYVGEEEYADRLEKKYNQKVRFIGREEIEVSSTMIRQSPIKYWSYIMPTFRRYLSTNVLLIGSASCGKTTLTRDLARRFNSEYILEYAREYQSENKLKDEELTAYDFKFLGRGMFDNIEKAIKNPFNSGLIIADSDVTTTKIYAQYYLNEEDYKELEPSYNMLIKEEKWDAILIIPPVIDYVDDGYRDMAYSDNETRWEMHNRFLQECISNGWKDKIFLLKATGDEEDINGYYARYEEAEGIIKKIIRGRV